MKPQEYIYYLLRICRALHVKTDRIVQIKGSFGYNSGVLFSQLFGKADSHMSELKRDSSIYTGILYIFEEIYIFFYSGFGFILALDVLAEMVNRSRNAYIV